MGNKTTTPPLAARSILSSCSDYAHGNREEQSYIMKVTNIDVLTVCAHFKQWTGIESPLGQSTWSCDWRNESWSTRDFECRWSVWTLQMQIEPSVPPTANKLDSVIGLGTHPVTIRQSYAKIITILTGWLTPVEANWPPYFSSNMTYDGNDTVSILQETYHQIRNHYLYSITSLVCYGWYQL